MGWLFFYVNRGVEQSVSSPESLSGGRRGRACLRNKWGYSSIGRASALQAEGSGFDSQFLY